MRILLTRPELRGETTASALHARGHEVLQVPLMHIEAIVDADLGHGPWHAVALTSASAVTAIAMHPRRDELRRIPTFAVGERTRGIAARAGFENVQASAGGVDALASVIIAAMPQASDILYIAGEDRAGDLAGLLSGAGHRVTTAVIYHAVAESRFPDAISDAMATDKIDAVLHFSRRSAATFVELAQAASFLVNILKYKHFCLSDQVAEPLLAAGAKEVIVAARPDEAALLALVGDA